MKQAGSKTSKKSAKKSNHKEQFTSMLKVVKPKVYITDSSSFKALVQELTGRGGGDQRISSGSRTQEQRSTSIPTQQIAHTSNFLDEVCEERMSNSLSPLTASTIEQTWLVPEVPELAMGQKNERLWSIEDDGNIFDDCFLDYYEEDEFLPCLESFDQLEDLYSITRS